jgi:hypothetical protein
MERNCGTCRFFQWLDGNFGECRVAHPVVFRIGDSPFTQWPEVAKVEWCGEYREQREMGVE